MDALKVQGSLPRRGHADAAAPIAVVPVVDVEPVAVEVPDVHTVAVRVDARGASVEATEEVDAPDRLVDSHPPDLFGSVGHHLEVGEELLLLSPRLGRGVRHDALAEHQPAAGHLVVAGELLGLVVVPAALLGVEVAPLQLTDVEERHLTGRARHEHEVVATQPLQRLPVGESALELGDLVVGVGEASSGGDLLWGDEVVAEDLTGEGVVGNLGRVATDEGHEIGLEVPTTIGETLDVVLVGLGGVERIFHEAQDVLLLTGRDVGHHLLLLL